MHATSEKGDLVNDADWSDIPFFPTSMMKPLKYALTFIILLTLVMQNLVHDFLQSIKSNLSVLDVFLEASPSLRDKIKVQADQLRDPHIFEDIDGTLYLLHVEGGKQAIGIQKFKTV